MYYGQFGDDVGISREGDLLDLGVNNSIVEKSGTWFSYGGERLGQGRENSRTYLRDNPAVADQIEREVRTVLGIELAGDKPDSAKSDSGDSDSGDSDSGDSNSGKSRSAKSTAGEQIPASEIVAVV